MVVSPYNCHSREGGNPDYCKASKLLTLKELPFKFSVSIHKTGIWIPAFQSVRECPSTLNIIIPTEVGIQRSYWYYRRYWIPSFDGMMRSGAFSTFSDRLFRRNDESSDTQINISLCKNKDFRNQCKEPEIHQSYHNNINS